MRTSKFKKDVLINVAFGGLNLLALMWIVRFAGIVFAPYALGYFLLSRRISEAGGNLLQFGSSKTLMRYLSINIEDPESKRNFVVFSGLMWGIITVTLVPIFYGFRDIWARWWFSEGADYELMAFWSGILMLATVINFIAANILLAERRMVSTNIVSLLNVAGFLILPLFLLPSANQGLQGIVQVIRFQALGMILLSMGVIVSYLKQLRLPFLPGLSELKATGKVFRDYGLVRTVSPFLDTLILLIGPWLLRKRIEEAGFLIIALTLVKVIQVAINPIVEVASITAARYLGQERDDLINEGVKLILGTSLYVTVISIVIFFPWCHYLLQLWLHETRIVQGVLPYINILLWGLLPFTIFHSLKGIIEIRWVRPFNLVTLLAATTVTLLAYQLISGIWGPFWGICIALLAGFWLMGLLSIFWLRECLQGAIHYFGIVRLAGLSALLAGLNVWSANQPVLWFGVLLSSISTILVLALVLFVMPSPFICDFRKFVLPQVYRGN
jgi:hypothetical protein